MRSPATPHNRIAGYTLIELSIVLVIIGLIVGGVLVGEHLIRAAEVRATISQIEKYKTAVNTFYGKYEALPGDLNYSTAASNGFAARGGVAGQGDGNGIIEGSDGSTNSGVYQSGETLMFWEDLSYANGMKLGLIEGAFNAVTPTTTSVNVIPPNFPQYLPVAKLGGGNFMYVYSSNGQNYYGMSMAKAITNNVLTSNSSLPSIVAYTIDSKLDDGIANTGNITSNYVNTTLTTSPDYVASLDLPHYASLQPYEAFLKPVKATSTLLKKIRQWIVPDANATITFSTATGTFATFSAITGSISEINFNAVCSQNGIYATSVNGGAGAYCALSFRF